jgi:hypothetical protein
MCERIETDKVIALNENGRRLTIHNPQNKEIGVVQVDGCLINDNSRRVDVMIRLPIRKKMRHGVQNQKLVEFKGSNIPHAFSQMEATLRHPALAETVHLVDEGFIVSKRKPAMDSSVQVAMINFRTSFNIPINVVTEASIDAS